MDISDTSILQELLSLSRESAAADASISAEISSVKRNIEEMTKRMDKQDILLEHLATQVNEQKRLTEEVANIKKSFAEEVAKLKETIEEQNTQIQTLQNAPAKKALAVQNKVSGKFLDGIITFIVSAFTSGIVVVLSKIFIGGK